MSDITLGLLVLANTVCIIAALFGILHLVIDRPDKVTRAGFPLAARNRTGRPLILAITLTPIWLALGIIVLVLALPTGLVAKLALPCRPTDPDDDDDDHDWTWV